jgi:hypothetical protein
VRYSHLAPEHLRAAVAVLDGVLPGGLAETAEISARFSARACSPPETVRK